MTDIFFERLTGVLHALGQLVPRPPRLARHRVLLILRARSSCRPTPTSLSRSNPTCFPLGQRWQITFHIISLPERSAQLNPVSRSLEFEVGLGGGEVIGDIPGFGRVLPGRFQEDEIRLAFESTLWLQERRILTAEQVSSNSS